MSVLINGIKFPKKCLECTFLGLGGFCEVAPIEVDDARVAPTVDEAAKQGKPEWCPLVKVNEDRIN